MRVVLAGTAAERARLRSQLEASGLEIIGEFASPAAARRAAADADAIVITPSALEDRRSSPSLADRDELRRAGPRDPRDLREARDRDDDEIIEPLTAREIQVLELLAEGLPNKAIAGRLGISDQTVKFHVASITGKLGAANRTDAVRRAVRRGLITL